MKIEYLREFCVLAKVKSFQQAAEELFISQSSLSKHIQSLEMEFGHELIDHKKRNVILTEFGSLVLNYAIEITELSSKYEKYFMQHFSKKDHLTICVMQGRIIRRISNILMSLKSKDMEFAFQIIEANYEQIKDYIDSGSCSFAFIEELSCTDSLFDDDRYEKISLSQGEELILIVPSNHRFANRGSVDLSELKNEKFVQTLTDNFFYKVNCELCRSAEFEPEFICNVRKTEMVVHLVQQGIGITILPKHKIKKMQSDHLSFLKLNTEAYIRSVLVYLKQRRLSVREKWLISYFQKNKLI